MQFSGKKKKKDYVYNSVCNLSLPVIFCEMLASVEIDTFEQQSFALTLYSIVIIHCKNSVV